MNEKSLKIKRWEMDSIWKSFEWLMKEKLVYLDNHARAMQAEMRTMGVPADMIAEFLPQQFQILMNEVIQEQDLRYLNDERREKEHGTSM